MIATVLATSASAGAISISVVTAILGSSLVAGVLTAVLTGLRAAAATRRDSYAAAVEAVVAWAEYPYRVRRRTDDEPGTLGKLAGLGSDLQERLARSRAWVATESSAVAAEFDCAIGEIREKVGDAVVEAWRAAPVTTADGMNVAPFGPGDLGPLFLRLNTAVRWRFGLRRVVPNRIVRRVVGCPPEGVTPQSLAQPPADSGHA